MTDMTDALAKPLAPPPIPSGLSYSRVLLKISGESLMGKAGFGLDADMMQTIAAQIRDVHKLGVQLCLVIGGGNIFRGVQVATKGMDRTTGDYMGMLATVMNALAMQAALEKIGVPTRVQSAIPMQTICEPYIRRRAQRHLEKGRVVIFAAGTGNPFFTTDSGAALRAAEMDCQVLLKATKTNGVYDKDPAKHADAKRYQTISYQAVLEQNLQVMDAAAISLCREKNVPIKVFSIFEPDSFANIIRGNGEFTEIKT